MQVHFVVVIACGNGTDTKPIKCDCVTGDYEL